MVTAPSCVPRLLLELGCMFVLFLLCWPPSGSGIISVLIAASNCPTTAVQQYSSTDNINSSSIIMH